MIHDLLTWAGWFTDNTFPQPGLTFWATPLGLLFSASLAACSAIRLMRPDEDENIFDSLYHLIMVFVFMSAFCVGWAKDDPHYIVKTLLMMMAFRAWWRLLVDLAKARRKKG